MVHVPPRLPGTARFDGRYKRAGDDLAAPSGQSCGRCLPKQGPDFSAQPCPGATLADLSSESIALRERWHARAATRRRELSDLQNAARCRTAGGGRPGELCGARLVWHACRLTRWLAQAELVFEYRSSEAINRRPTARNTARASSPGKTRCGKRSTCATTGRATRTISSGMDLPTLTRYPCARPSERGGPSGLPAGWLHLCAAVCQGLEVVSPAACRPASRPEHRLTNSSTRATAAWPRRWDAAG